MAGYDDIEIIEDVSILSVFWRQVNDSRGMTAVERLHGNDDTGTTTLEQLPYNNCCTTAYE